MASSSLLALLNFSQPSAASPSSSTTAPQSDSALVSENGPSRAPPARSTPPKSESASTAANALLQSILSPGIKSQDPYTFPEPKSTSIPSTAANVPVHSPSSAVASPSRSAKDSANDLLALLSSNGSRKQPEAATPTVQRTDNTPLHRNDQKLKQRPIGTPPGHQSQRESTKSPVQSMFDSPSLFDMLQQASDKMTNERQDAEVKDRALEQVQAIDLTSAITSATATFASNLATTYPINPRLHASYHLSGLHASAGFEDSISSGLDVQITDGVANYTLDLSAPQPAGSSSLYPAKLEILPISVLTTPFSPSFYANQEEGDGDSTVQWPCQRVGSLEGKYAMYIMSKGRVRIINQENGFRHFARADASGIRSIVTPQDRSKGKRSVFAAITEGGHLYVWSMDNIAQQQDATIIAIVAADSGKTFTYALWRPGGASEELLLVQSDGSIGLLSVQELERRMKEGKGALHWTTSQKNVPSASSMRDAGCAGAALSSDGSLLAFVQRSRATHPATFQLRLESLTHSNVQHAVNLPSFSSLGVSRISFVSFADQGGNKLPQCLLIGYDSNQVIAVIDLTTGSVEQILRFKASVPSFSLAVWHAASSSLLLACSVRSSIFSWRPRFTRLPSLEASVSGKIAIDFGASQGQPMNHSCEVIGRIKFGQLPCLLLDSQPFMKECALPDPYSSVALDGSSDGIHIIATHIGGIHGLHLPEEALKQAARKEVQSEAKGALIAKGPEPANQMEATAGEELKRSSEQTKNTLRAVKETDGAKKANKGGKKTNIDASVKHAEAKMLIAEEGNKASQEISGATRPSATVTDVSRLQQSNGIDSNDIKALLGEMETRIVDGIRHQAAKNERTLAETANTAATSLLPKLEATINSTIDRQLKVAVNDAVRQALPSELHQLLLRPELVQHLTSAITSSVVPPVRKTAMDVVSQALAPHFEGIMADLQQSMEAKMDMAVTGIRKDIVTEQSKALIGAEARIEQLTSQIEAISKSMHHLIEQNEALDKKLNEVHSQPTLPAPAGLNSPPRREEIATARYLDTSSTPAQKPLYQASHFHQPHQPSGNYAVPGHAPNQSRHTSYNYSGPNMNTFLPQHLQQQQQQPPSHQLPGQQTSSMATLTSQETEDLLLAALSDPNADTDLSVIRSTLERLHVVYGSPSNALRSRTDTASGPSGKANVSQAVILTLLHRLSKILNDRPEHNTLLPEMAVPWLEACAAALDRRDDSIAPIFAHIQQELLNQLIQAHRKLQHRALWWTDERLSYGILHYLQ